MVYRKRSFGYFPYKYYNEFRKLRKYMMNHVRRRWKNVGNTDEFFER